jgi:hypothetical protein
MTVVLILAPSGSLRRVFRASRPLTAMLQVVRHVTLSHGSSLLLASCYLLSRVLQPPFLCCCRWRLLLNPSSERTSPNTLLNPMNSERHLPL